MVSSKDNVLGGDADNEAEANASGSAWEEEGHI
jgi:hypothetical protein